jgi:hypothetical protein
MNLLYSNRDVPRRTVVVPPPPPQRPVHTQPTRGVSIATKSMFERTIKPEGGCGCGGH